MEKRELREIRGNPDLDPLPTAPGAVGKCVRKITYNILEVQFEKARKNCPSEDEKLLQ